jgi:hypothetical protein
MRREDRNQDLHFYQRESGPLRKAGIVSLLSARLHFKWKERGVRKGIKFCCRLKVIPQNAEIVIAHHDPGKA